MASALGALLLGSACASHVISVEDRVVPDELVQLEWRPASASEIAGHWRAAAIRGPAAAVVMDIAYWIEPGGEFSGAALFAGTPPRYEVLSGKWTLSSGGLLQLGMDAAPARAEVAQGRLRLSGDEGSLVLERGELR